MRTQTGLRVRKVLTPTGGFLSGFAWSLNPYVGCAFGHAGGCPFCYVRALPVARRAIGAWGSWVLFKSNLPEILERELCAMARAGRLAESAIFMSSATDPYQGLERRLGLTRAALELFVRYSPRRLLIQTRSPLIERDLDLIARMGSRAIVSLTLETDDDAVRRAITPTSPSVERRLDTARRIRDRGIALQLAIAPMMPNRPERFAALVEPIASRVVVDTYFDGDGAHGARSRALGIGALYERLGYGQWFRPDAHAALMEAMRARLGPERVLFSRAGFNAL